MPTLARRGLSATMAVLAATLIAHWEGEDLTAKHNSFDPAGVITVCDGVTNYDWPWLKVGMKFTHAQCQAALIKLIPKYAAPLSKCIDNFEDLPPHRQAALISASYNLGPNRICKSRGGGDSIASMLNNGDVQKACETLTQYESANGVKLTGLVRRRTDPHWGEVAWCLRND